MKDFYDTYAGEIVNNFPVDKTTPVDEIKKQHNAKAICKQCTCSSPVFGYGSYYPDIMIIGMEPTEYDTTIGIPFASKEQHKVHGYTEYLKRSPHISTFWYTYLHMCREGGGDCFDRLVLELSIANPRWLVALGEDVLNALKGIGSPTFPGTEGGVAHMIKLGTQYYPVYILTEPEKLYHDPEKYRSQAKYELDFISNDTRKATDYK